MATQVTAYPASVTQTGSETSWTNPTNAQGPPDSNTADCDSFSIARALSCTTFGFAIPTNATITGFVVTPIGSLSGDPVQYGLNVYEGGGSSLGGGTVSGIGAFGSESSGIGLTPANVNNLRVVLAWATTGDISTVNLDAVKVDVYYAVGSTPRDRASRLLGFSRAGR